MVRTLLTECTLDAEAVNLKGRNPLHELARCGKDNAANICELFLECMSQYPVNNAGKGYFKVLIFLIIFMLKHFTEKKIFLLNS